MARIGSAAVAVLSWNGLEHLKICLDALGEQQDPGIPWEIWVLDNGSSDGTAEWLESTRPEVKLLRSERNLGFCVGNNHLIDHIDADAVLLLNNDTRAQPQWLVAMIEALSAAPADVAAVSGLILDWEGERLDFGRGIMTFDGHAFQHGYRRPLEEAQLPADGSELFFACGGNMIIRRRSFLDAGGFDPRYFAYLEDVDLGWRLWAGGERVLFSRDGVVHHRSMATSDLLGAFNRGFLFERNAFLTVSKNYDDEMWPLLMPVVELVLLARTRTLLVENNPGGAQLIIDPHALPQSLSLEVKGTTPRVAASSRLSHLKNRLLELGPSEFLRRGWRRVAGGRRASADSVALTDPRSVAQLRAAHSILVGLDSAAQIRQVARQRRVRADREIFERFPLWLVPTYPGDEVLFDSPGFASWLPPGVELERARLDQVMET